MADILKSKTSKVLILFTTIFLVVMTYLYSGIFYGWSDDAMVLNLFNGKFSQYPYHVEVLFRGLSYVLSFLYTKALYFPWYGIFLFISLFTSVYLILLYLFESIKFKKIINWILLILLMSCVYIIFLEEFIVLINFTKASVLLTGISLLFFWRNLNLKKAIVFHPILILFIIGYLIRDQTANVITLFVVLLVILETFINKSCWTALKKFLITISTILLVLNILFSVSKTSDWSIERETWPYISNIIDGNRFANFYEKQMSTEDSIKLVAMRSYYFLDNKKIDIQFLEETGGKSSLNLGSLRKWRNYIKLEIPKLGDRFESEHRGLNLLYKMKITFVLSASIILLTLLLFIKNLISTKAILIVVLSFLSFYTYFFLITIFFKYEDRLFTPVYIILLCFIINYVKLFFQKTQPVFIIILICCLMPFSILRAASLSQIIDFKKEDLQNKKEYINELNTFKNKIFIYDYWSQLLIYTSPFKEVNLDKRNTHIVFGDIPLFYLKSYRKYIQQVTCPFKNYEEFYECVAKKDNIIFVMPPFRAQILEAYFKILYNKNFLFKEIYPNSVLNSKTTLFTWDTIKFKYYKLEELKETNK